MQKRLTLMMLQINLKECNANSGKMNSLFNLINYQGDSKFLINKRERTGLEHLNDSKAFS